MPLRPTLCASLIVATLFASGARAQPLPASDLGEPSQEADQLFRKGKAAVAQGNMPEAYEAYKAAWALKQSPDIACNLGNVELELNHAVDAAMHLRHCLKIFPSTESADRRAKAEELFRTARSKVGGLKIETSVAAALVSIDGKEVGRSPLDGEVFVEAGDRTVEAKLDGYAPARQAVSVSAGGTGSVALKLTPTSGPAGPDTVERKPSLPLIIAGGVVAATGIGLGIGFTVASNGAAADARDVTKQLVSEQGGSVCKGTHAGDSRCADVESSLSSKDTFRTAAIVSFIGGGVVGVGTLVYALVGGRPSRSSTTSGLTVFPTPVGRGAGLGAVGIW